MAEMIYIDDNNYESFVNPTVNGEVKTCSAFGLFKPTGFASQVKEFSDQERIPLIPKTEWDDRIAQQNRDKTTLSNLALELGLDVLDQNGTNYCWANGVTFSAMLARLKESGQKVRYSPASIAAPIKNFQNRGGWGEEALDYMIRNGINIQRDWPANAIDRRYFNDANKEKARQHIPVEYYRCRTWEEVVSSIIAGYPVAVGFNWWRHLVCGVEIMERTHDLKIANSWGTDWSEYGYGILRGNKKYPDGESVAICNLLAM